MTDADRVTGPRAVVEAYFSALRDRRGWERLLADDIVFTSHTSPVRRRSGRTTMVEATKRFYATIETVDVQQMLVDGDRVVVLTRYSLRPPAGETFSSDVAEVFEVRDGAIASFDIYFDSAPYPK